MASGIQVSLDRWLIVSHNRGFRGIDDDLSTLYQLRAGSPVGKLIKEGLLSRSDNDWEPFGDGRTYSKQHGHIVACGVPKGAIIGGRPAPHANVFVIKWFRLARMVVQDPQYGEILISCVPLIPHLRENYGSYEQTERQLQSRTWKVVWMQFRLNEKDDDIEILQPVTEMQQQGCEGSPQICSNKSITVMDQVHTEPVPYNKDCTEWVHVHSAGGSLLVAKMKYNSQRGLYEWTEVSPTIAWRKESAGELTGTGSAILDKNYSLAEASIARYQDDWVLCSRCDDGDIAWLRLDDPFSASAIDKAVQAIEVRPRDHTPLSMYVCPDGVMRLFGGDVATSPYPSQRNPLYCWDIDPDNGFAKSNCRVLFDSFAAGMPEAMTYNDQVKLVPHSGGRIQWIFHRTRSAFIKVPWTRKMLTIQEEDKELSGTYHARITYTDEYPGVWEFSGNCR